MPPQLGITKKAIVHRILDGDTLDVMIVIPARLRLLDCWAPEIRGSERDEGLEAKKHLETLLPLNSMAIVQIPTDDASNLSDLFSFGRALANVWPKNQDLSANEQMVLSGFATKTKQ